MQELRNADAHARGVACFENWAAHFSGCPRRPARLVRGVDSERDYAGVLTTEWEARDVRWKTVPYGGTQRAQPAPMTPADVDPWNADASEVRTRSDHVTTCDACGAKGKDRCAHCGATGRLVCASCQGQRKQYGYAVNGSRRLLNCTTCRGKGEVDCGNCRRGIATCAVCAGEKRVQRWITIECRRRTETTTYPRSAVLDGEVVADIERDRAIGAADLGSVPKEWLLRLSPTQSPGERAVRQQLRIVEVPRLVVHYHLGASEHTAQFGGRALVPLTAEQPFEARATWLRALGAVFIATAIVISIIHLARGAFYWSGWSLLAIASFGVLLVLLWLAAAEHTATRRATRAWLGGAVAAAVATALFFAFAQPNVEHVRTLIALNQFDAAEQEIRALGPGHSAEWADLRLARIQSIGDLDPARRELAEIPQNAPQYRAAAAFVDALVLENARQKVQTREYSAAAKLLGSLSADTRRRPGADAIAADISSALRGQAERLTAHAQETSDRQRRLANRVLAEHAWVELERAGDLSGREQLIAVRSAMARDVAALEKSARRRR